MDICRDWYFETLIIGDGERLIFSDKLLNEVFTRWVLKLKLEDHEDFIKEIQKDWLKNEIRNMGYRVH